MKIFVTGATGFIGSAVAGALARAGHDVLGLTRGTDRSRVLESLEVEPLIGNLDDAHILAAAVSRCEVLVHCAAEYSQRYLELDRQAVVTMLEEAEHMVRPRLFIYTSGVWVYGETGEHRVDESDDVNPPAMVTARVENERAVLAANQGVLRTLVLRPGCVYGGHGSLTAMWFQSAEQDGVAQFVGEGHQRWATVHRDDLADAYIRAVESREAGEVFNIVDHSRSSVRECASAAAKALGKSGETHAIPVATAVKKLGPMAECLALDQNVDSSKATRRLGWIPRHTGFVDDVRRYSLSWGASRSAGS
ncbi:MAG: NAD-dependent epimerase/dehydratase family protein [Planctomycetes bacterium]|nr:NAD-dependent epimerase/dehydratase family protein [Planctomycetota bacterium]